MIAGPNGSGKSTLIALLQSEGVDFGLHFNADDIARQMAGDAATVARTAQAEVRQRRDDALRARHDYSWETVMSHPSHVEHLAMARAAGYDSRLIFVAVDDPETNIGRVAQRVARGGHDVPTDRVVTRYERSLALLPNALAASNHARVFDNSDRNKPFRPLLRKERDTLLLSVLSDAWPSWFRRFVADLQHSGSIRL